MTVFEELMRQIREHPEFPPGVGSRVEDFFREERALTIEDNTSFRSRSYSVTTGEQDYNEETAWAANVDSLFAWMSTSSSKMCVATNNILNGESFNFNNFPECVRDWLQDKASIGNDSLNYVEHDSI